MGAVLAMGQIVQTDVLVALDLVEKVRLQRLVVQELLTKEMLAVLGKLALGCQLVVVVRVQLGKMVVRAVRAVLEPVHIHRGQPLRQLVRVVFTQVAVVVVPSLKVERHLAGQAVAVHLVMVAMVWLAQQILEVVEVVGHEVLVIVVITSAATVALAL
jgi:hypothetical protein